MIGTNEEAAVTVDGHDSGLPTVADTDGAADRMTGDDVEDAEDLEDDGCDTMVCDCDDEWIMDGADTVDITMTDDLDDDSDRCDTAVGACSVGAGTELDSPIEETAADVVVCNGRNEACMSTSRVSSVTGVGAEDERDTVVCD